MGIAPISNDNIKVGYISEDDGYVRGVVDCSSKCI